MPPGIDGAPPRLRPEGMPPFGLPPPPPEGPGIKGCI